VWLGHCGRRATKENRAVPAMGWRRGASEEGNGRGGARARRKTNGSRKVQAKLRVRFVPLYPGLSHSERDIHVSFSLVGWFARWLVCSLVGLLVGLVLCGSRVGRLRSQVDEKKSGGRDLHFVSLVSGMAATRKRWWLAMLLVMVVLVIGAVAAAGETDDSDDGGGSLGAKNLKLIPQENSEIEHEEWVPPPPEPEPELPLFEGYLDAWVPPYVSHPRNISACERRVHGRSFTTLDIATRRSVPRTIVRSWRGSRTRARPCSTSRSMVRDSIRCDAMRCYVIASRRAAHSELS